MHNNDEHLLKILTVETLRVYNFILRHNPPEMALEQIAGGLNLTKPTVLHHIEKLKTVGLVEATSTGYKVKEVVKIAIIKGYTRIFEKLLASWVPVIFIFFILAIISILTINQIQIQVTMILLCAVGIIIAIREIQKVW